jgi:branched-subunit amino acid transport protein
MSAVTFIPRLMPLVLVRADKLPKRFKLFLSYIPYAVLGALIIPDGFSGIPGSVWISTAVLAVAALVSWYRNSVILTFLISVVVAWGLQSLF